MSSVYLVVLIELTAEGHCEVGGGTGCVVGGKQILPVVKGTASSLTDLHVLETGLHTAGSQNVETHHGCN